jgi:hypothetical protein
MSDCSQSASSSALQNPFTRRHSPHSRHSVLALQWAAVAARHSWSTRAHQPYRVHAREPAQSASEPATQPSLLPVHQPNVAQSSSARHSSVELSQYTQNCPGFRGQAASCASSAWLLPSQALPSRADDLRLSRWTSQSSPPDWAQSICWLHLMRLAVYDEQSEEPWPPPSEPQAA